MKDNATVRTASVAAADLARAVAFARLPVERRNTIPVLGMILMRFEPGRLTVCGTDLDTHCEMRVEAECDAPFGFCVTPDRMAAVARIAGNDRVAIAAEITERKQTAKDKSVHVDTVIACEIKAGDLSARFNSIIPHEDFPAFVTPEGDGVASARISAIELHRLLADTIPCISTEETRYYLHGIYVHAKEDGLLRAVATDGHRLALRRSDTAFPATLNGILPSRTAHILHRVLRADGNATISLIGTGLKQVAAPDTGDWRIGFNLIDGNFPDYTRIIPQAASTWSVPISLGMIQRAMSFASRRLNNWRECGHHLKFDLPAGKLSARLDDASEVAFPLTGASGDVVVGFNGIYLRGFLRRNSQAWLHSKGLNDPAFVETEDPMLTQVLMPMRV